VNNGACKNAARVVFVEEDSALFHSVSHSSPPSARLSQSLGFREQGEVSSFKLQEAAPNPSPDPPSSDELNITPPCVEGVSQAPAQPAAQAKPKGRPRKA
jgi:hypothetical protein